MKGDQEVNRLHRGMVVVLAVSSLFSLSLAAWAQETTKTGDTGYKRSALVEKVKGGEIDWGAEFITATGEGRVPSETEEPNAAKAYLRAKGYARMDAIKNLYIVIEGAPIDYEGFGKDYMAQDETLRQAIKGYVRNVQILDEQTVKVRNQEIVRITVGTRMYGKNAPGSAFLKGFAEKEAAPRMESETKSSEKSLDIPKHMPVKVELQKTVMAEKAFDIPAERAPVLPAIQAGPFTSLIVDTRNLKVMTCMSPKIRRNDGSEVWGTIPVSPDFAIETGIVGYVADMESARKNNRSGDNPLIIKAIGRAGGAAMCDAVISDEDAKLILDENSKSKICDKCNVIFVIDK